MFNIQPLEILVILLLALVLFGPKRLPEIARRASSIARDIKETTDEFRAGLEREYDDLVQPLKEMGDEARRSLEEGSSGTPPRESEEEEHPEA